VELRTITPSVMFEGPNVDDAMRKAAEWLERAGATEEEDKE